MPEITSERIAITTLVLLVLVQSARLAWSRTRAARRLAANRKMGAEGERSAEHVLRREGYRIEARQPTTRVTYVADGAPRVFDVRADLLVSRDGERHIVEVKTGDHATDISSRATRRQLLEYAHAFGVDAVLLLDAEHGTITEVRLPARAARAPRVLTPLLVGAVLGAMTAVLFDEARSRDVAGALTRFAHAVQALR